MSDFDTILSNSELITEVRDALAGLDATKVPDDTITQTANKFVIPLLNQNIPDSVHNNQSEYQDEFDSAVIAWTAELSFDAWLEFNRLRDREVEVYTDGERYREKLAKRTNLALQLVESTRPSQLPNHVVTVKHDGVKRRVDLQQPWVPE
jgi:hypothetical protein